MEALALVCCDEVRDPFRRSYVGNLAGLWTPRMPRKLIRMDTGWCGRGELTDAPSWCPWPLALLEDNVWGNQF